MKGVGATIPKWDADAKRPIDIELQIDKCRVENMGAEAYKFDAGDQKALTAFIKHQSLGMPVQARSAAGRHAELVGEGQGDLLHPHRPAQPVLRICHEASKGKYIRADHLSQGQVNGFPTYRLKTGGLVSLQNRFRGCIRDTRAEMPKAFSDELMALEVYVTWRGTGPFGGNAGGPPVAGHGSPAGDCRPFKHDGQPDDSGRAPERARCDLRRTRCFHGASS